ncbi:hypothetical protein [Devosia sp.]|uniref:hypothetical protein n=1 Tax=Devosia sp. TaxID=1871048 RepID=UPI0019FE3733|nr:hypothetical protein [Devosia sp.]MBE0580825.1 hypothetical protein [Devosia sp.]
MLNHENSTGLPIGAMSRRALLAGLGTATASAALAVPAIAAIQPGEAGPILTPRERLDQAIAEFKAAYEAIYDDVDDWIMVGHGDIPIPRVKPKPVLWSGDGRYEVENGSRRPVYWLTREPRYDDNNGERWFRVSTGFKGAHEPSDFFCPERYLPTIVRRVS